MASVFLYSRHRLGFDDGGKFSIGLRLSHDRSTPGKGYFLAEVTGVTDRRVQFRVEAWDEKEKIGEGAHERAIVNVARFAAKLAEKKQ
jgi:predicted thioesterase